MNCHFQDFIGVWDDIVPPQLCDDIIDLAERITNHNAHNSKFISDGGNQFSVEGKNGRHDTQIYLTDYESEFCDEINHYLTTCISEYCEEYPQLKTISLASYTIKCQITPPSGGYHVWHYENIDYENSSRELVWTVYLNDMPDGEAETEFLYQKRRITAKKGRICIFPACMTHVHRGNTVFTHNKYILTGWVNKVR